MSFLTQNISIKIKDVSFMKWGISNVNVAARPYHALVLRLSGSASFACDGLEISTQPGDVFKLKGKGIQKLGGKSRGDQFVRVTIEVPKNLNREQKKLIKEFEEISNEKNYAQRNSFFEKLKRMFND